MTKNSPKSEANGLAGKLRSFLGRGGWVASEDSLSWQRDWLDQYGEPPIGVARPRTTSEVSDVLRLCSSEGVAVVPQGGNTGLVGGSVSGKSGDLILSLDRMRQISEPDIMSGHIYVEAGVVLEQLHASLSERGLWFPMHLGSQGSAQIGGLIATNAGGSHAFQYGMMQDLVVGLEVVLPDGTVWDGMRAVQKDNTGYQLRKLFCGSEGTLGVITRAILKLSPEPRQRTTALLSLANMDKMVEFGALLKAEVGEFLFAMEFFSEAGLRMVLNNFPDLSMPLRGRQAFYLLVEVGSGSKDIPLATMLSDIIERAMIEELVSDCVIAMSEAQRAFFWRLREEQPEGQRRSGEQLKHDLSIPVGKLPEFLAKANVICNETLSGIIVNPFGHLGDGNVHLNLSPPAEEKDFVGSEVHLSFELYKLASDMGGSFAAEHGIGRAKIGMAESFRSETERKLFQSLKFALDEKNQLNPGVLINKQTVT